MTDGIPFLPEEIIRNILERLPVKSLIRFQCVCRRWRIFFKTRSFIANHLDHSNQQNPCLLLERDEIVNPLHLYCLDSEMQVWELQKPPLLHYFKQVKVYSLSLGAWKELEFRLHDIVRLSPESVTVNGVMFWSMPEWFGDDTDYDDEGWIVSFDLAVEVFTVIPIPELQPIKLTVYEEKLAIISWKENSEHSAIDMWVMEEGVGASGERWGWTKKYTSSPNPCFLNPICFLNPRTIWRNEIVCCPHGEDEPTVLLNLTTEKMKKFAIRKCDYRHCIFNYAESLVPVGGMKSSTNFL
ncbi:hypothetical protein K1719_001987 [Acacia pycnantha]|nr:hypothetical protein K1719_001987 [Acacia pycnantha]